MRRVVPALPRRPVSAAGLLDPDSLHGLGDAHWRLVADVVPSVLAVVDETGSVLTVNAAWHRWVADIVASGTVDHAATEAAQRPVGRSWTSLCGLFQAGDAAVHAAEGLRAVLAGESAGFDVVGACPPPLTDRWLRLYAAPFVSEQGPRVVLVFQDVSGFAQARAAVEEARNQLTAVTQSMSEGLFALDAGGHVTMMNASAEAMLGWTASELSGFVMHDVTHHLHTDGSDHPMHECPILEVRTAGVPVEVDDDVFVRRDGSLLPVSYTASPLVTADGVRGCVVVFRDSSRSREERERLRSRLDVLTRVDRLEETMRDDRLELYAQPIVDLATGEVVQHELLLRIREPDGTVVGPASYIATAEEHGLIGRIDRWVVRRAVELAAAGHSVEINVSAVSVSDPDLAGFIEHLVRRAGVDPSLMVFEITETGLITNEAAGRAFVEQLHRLGCRVALDDFGTGYGGFTYVKQLPVDYLKIDIEFVRDLLDSQPSRHVVRAVVALAAGFGLKTVAEGVEDAQTLHLLKSLGVDMAQGYHLGRPGPLDRTLLHDRATG